MVARLACAVVFFVLGLLAGLSWSVQSDRATLQRTVASGAEGITANEAAKRFGNEAGKFVKQAKDLTIRIKKAPIDAWASADGRFVIRLDGSRETIASELIYPAIEGIPDELVRHYSFSCGDKTFSCDFSRTSDGSRVTDVQFHFSDARGGELAYVDYNADGHWDKMVDRTGASPRYYRADGLCWKETANIRPVPPDATHELPHTAPVGTVDTSRKSGDTR